MTDLIMSLYNACNMLFNRYLFIVFIICTGSISVCFGQVTPGIKANGVVVNNGDTINVCQGSSITYQSVALGGGTLTWKFGSGVPSTSSSAGPFPVSYPTTGYDIAFQKIVSGNFADSMSVVVRISNEKPFSNFSFTPTTLNCGNIPIQFTSSSTGTALTYLWDFGDDTTSTQQNPSHQFLNAVGLSGTQQSYNVKLTVTNIYGCSVTSAQMVTVKKVPDATLSSNNALTDVQYTPDYGGMRTFKRCQPDNQFIFGFLNASSTLQINTDYSIQWDDGLPFEQITSWPVSHLYTRGNHKLTERVTGSDGCIGIRTYNVFLGTTPQGGVLPPLLNYLCVKDSFQLPISGIEDNPTGTTYEFSVNDNSPIRLLTMPIGKYVFHPTTITSCGYTNNGFTATLKITNACSTAPTISTAGPLYVLGRPKANMKITPATKNICINKPVSFESTSVFGQVVTSTGNCVNTGSQVWVITPSAGVTVTSGTLGDLNGSPGDGSGWKTGTSNLQVNFTKAAVYTIKLYVTNTRCGMDSTSSTICVRNPPQANFSLPQKSSCGPTSFIIPNSSPLSNECDGDEYDWAITYSDPLSCSAVAAPQNFFTNGTTRASSSPEVQFQVPGRYIIVLSVKAKNSNAECVASKSNTFYVKGPPKAVINPVGSVCLGNKILAVTNAAACYSSGSLTYQWTFTGGTPSSSLTKIPDSVSYAATGTYPILLTVMDSECNLSSTSNGSVIISSAPVARAGNDTTICSKQILVIGMQKVAGVSYQWTPATNLSSATVSNPAVTIVYKGPAADTTFTYKLRAFVGVNCAAEDSIRITVKRSPVITINPLNPEICSGDSVQITAAGADSYNWTPALTLTNNNTNITFAKPSVTTKYTVTGTLQNACSDTATISVKVNAGAKAQFTLTDKIKCTGTNLNTVVKPVPSAIANTSYSWYVNDSLVAKNVTGIFPSYPLTTAGITLTIKLVVTSAGGCRPDSMQLNLDVAQSVTAKFTKDLNSGCGSLKVSFVNTSSTLNNIKFFWNFGNGQSSTDITPPAILYNSSPSFRDTTYYVLLKAFNGCDSTYWNDSVKVQAPAKARFGLDYAQGCSPFTAIFNNTSPGNNTAYYWHFDDGFKDTSFTKSSISHLYTTGIITSYNVRMIAVNDCGRDTQLINVVVVPTTIKPQVTVNGNQLFGCTPHTATFINNSTGAAKLIWKFGDGTDSVITANSQNNVSHTFNGNGIFNVSIRLLNDCSDTTIFRQVTVYNAPVAHFNMDSLACTGNQVKALNMSNGDAYKWIWGDGITSSEVNGVHAYTSASVYTVRLVARGLNNSGLVCADTSSKQIHVLDKIIAKINIVPGKPCAPYLMKVVADGADMSSQVNWIFSDSSKAPGIFTATGTQASYQYNLPGSYTVKMIVANAAGCADSITLNVTVTASLKVMITPVNITTCNIDTTIIFKTGLQNPDGAPVNYKWFINGQLSGFSNPFTYRFQALAGNISASVFRIRALAENAAGCGDTADAGTINIQPLSKPSIRVLPSLVQSQPDYDFTFSDTSAINVNKTWTWDLGDRTLQQRSGKEITYRYGDTGTYLVRLTVSDFATHCTITDSVKVTILYQPGYLQVPNAICPGCAEFGLRTFLPLGRGLATFHLWILNKTGVKVFETTSLDANGSPDKGWDGRYINQSQMQDVYQWVIEARYKNGSEWKGMKYPNSNKYIKNGFITVIK